MITAHISADKTYALVESAASKRIVKTLEAAGARVVSFPKAQTAACLLDGKARLILADAVNYDWLIFFDVSAVDYFLHALEDAQIDPFELDRRRICAVGEAVADRLRFAELHADVVPRVVQTTPILDAISDYTSAENFIENRFLLVKQKSAGSEIKDSLTRRGATADELEIYEAAIEEKTDAARLKVLLGGGAIDEFVFSAPEDWIALRAFLKTDDVSGFFNETTVSAADAVTFQFLREHELEPRYFSAK